MNQKLTEIKAKQTNPNHNWNFDIYFSVTDRTTDTKPVRI